MKKYIKNNDVSQTLVEIHHDTVGIFTTTKSDDGVKAVGGIEVKKYIKNNNILEYTISDDVVHLTPGLGYRSMDTHIPDISRRLFDAIYTVISPGGLCSNNHNILYVLTITEGQDVSKVLDFISKCLELRQESPIYWNLGPVPNPHKLEVGSHVVCSYDGRVDVMTNEYLSGNYSFDSELNSLDDIVLYTVLHRDIIWKHDVVIDDDVMLSRVDWMSVAYYGVLSKEFIMQYRHLLPLEILKKHQDMDAELIAFLENYVLNAGVDSLFNVSENKEDEKMKKSNRESYDTLQPRKPGSTGSYFNAYELDKLFQEGFCDQQAYIGNLGKVCTGHVADDMKSTSGYVSIPRDKFLNEILSDESLKEFENFVKWIVGFRDTPGSLNRGEVVGRMIFLKRCIFSDLFFNKLGELSCEFLVMEKIDFVTKNIIVECSRGEVYELYSDFKKSKGNMNHGVSGHGNKVWNAHPHIFNQFTRTPSKIVYPMDYPLDLGKHQMAPTIEHMDRARYLRKLRQDFSSVDKSLQTLKGTSNTDLGAMKKKVDKYIQDVTAMLNSRSEFSRDLESDRIFLISVMGIINEEFNIRYMVPENKSNTSFETEVLKKLDEMINLFKR